MKKTVSLILSLMLFFCVSAMAEETTMPAMIEQVSVYQSFDGEDAGTAIVFCNADCESVAVVADGAVTISNEFWTEWTQIRLLPEAGGTLAGAEGLMFHLKRTDVTKEGSKLNFTCQMFDGTNEYEYDASTMYIKVEGSEEWTTTPNYSGWGPNFTADADCTLFLPFSGFTKKTAGNTDDALNSDNIVFIQFWMNTYGAQHGNIVLDSFVGGVIK